MVEVKSNANARKVAYLGILSLGIVSLMGDIVYEGSRGIVPDYLKFLAIGSGMTVETSIALVSFVGGLGEFLGYTMRLLGGYLADTTRAYWVFIFLGYGLIVSIPLLGPLAVFGLGTAIALVLLERFGKAIRSPSRDTLLSIISKDVGAGKAFGLHELLDQIGAIIGPTIVFAVMFVSANNYGYTFTFLFVPYAVLLIVLAYTYKRLGTRVDVAETRKTSEKVKLEKGFYIYTFAVLLNTMGLISYTIILAKASDVLQLTGEQWIVPLMYTFIQGVDAPSALVSGYAYDKFGIRILVAPFIISVIPSLLAIASNELPILWIAAAFFGLVLGMHESVYRAAVSAFAPISSRGMAYGIFNTVYGVGFLISGGLYGLFIALNTPLILVICYVAAIQIVATFLLLKAWQLKHQPEQA
ncbi:MAG: MFS transporter [Candidatus Bathyarchaeales archaeon]